MKEKLDLEKNNGSFGKFAVVYVVSVMNNERLGEFSWAKKIITQLKEKSVLILVLYVIPAIERQLQKINLQRKGINTSQKICCITSELFLFLMCHSPVKNTGKGAGREALFEQI